MTAQQSEERRLTPDGQTDVVTLRELRRRRYWTQADLALAFEEQIGRAHV